MAPSRGINEARLIVGDASNPNIAGATFWLPSKTAVKIDLSSTAEQINDRGQIVGIVFPVSPGKAAVWQIEGYKPVLADIKAAAQICQGRPIFHN